MDGATLKEIRKIYRALEDLRDNQFSHYKGAQAGDFNTTTLPHHGDYGYQTTNNEVQMNCNGTVRAITTAAL